MKIVFLLVLLLLSFHSNASEEFAMRGVPTSIKMTGAGMLLPGFTHDSENCSNKAVRLPDEHPNFGAFLSLALAAQAQKKEIRVYVTGCDMALFKISAIEIL